MKVKCIHCKHEWSYSGTLLYATCPSCRLKTKSSFKEINNSQKKSSRLLLGEIE